MDFSDDVINTLEGQLDDLDPETRRLAFDALWRESAHSEIPLPPLTDWLNLHCHSFFSFNGYGYSPLGIVWRARKNGLFAVGLVDFDVLDGVSEFLYGCSCLGLKGGAGFETRVYIPEFADREINSPGEPGISYHMGMGFIPGMVNQPDVIENLAKTAQNRTREVTRRVNEHISEISLDFEREVLPMTPAGNATERHVCAAYEKKSRVFWPDSASRARWWAGKLGVDEQTALSAVDNPPAMQALIRSKLMKKGGPGYIVSEPDAFPSLQTVNAFTLANGAIPTMTFLDGTSAGEQALDELMDLMQASGVIAANIIPDRNWNYRDPEVRSRKAALMRDFLAKAQKRVMPVFAGTEMNAHGQRFVDDFTAPEMAEHHEQFKQGAWFLHAHTALQIRDGMGFHSDWARSYLPLNDKRVAFYTEAGRKLPPLAHPDLQAFHREMTPSDILRILEQRAG